ncbi:MAG: aldo/keto reductase [Spirochaetia bacterium]|nr:aldo/keto reductase [Spirochaetia bacterium]
MAQQQIFEHLFQPHLIPGRATAEGTRAYFTETKKSQMDHTDELWHADAGSTGLRASRLGFGGYRTARGVAAHADALRESLLTGTNVIDTSANYADGASESMVGAALRELTAAKRIERNNVIVVTKAGYIQGLNMRMVHGRARPYPQIVEYSRDCFHCIHPEFLDEQLDLSRRRLGLETIDVFLLHNPEYFLMDAKNRGRDALEARKEYEGRLHQAFLFLEKAAASGRIQHFGVSSNTMPLRADDPTATHLDRLLSFGCKSFRVIQFPANIIENDFRFNRTASGGTVCALAREHNLWTLANRPLNAFVESKGMFRLARMAEQPLDGGASTEAELQRIQNDMAETEEIILSLFQDRHFQFSAGEPSVSSLVQEYKDFFTSREHLLSALPALTGTIQKTMNRLHALAANDSDRRALEKYVRQANGSLALWERYTDVRHDRKLEPLETQIGAASANLSGQPLALQAVLFLLASDCPGTVLAGMRRREYVRQLSKAYRLPPPRESELLGIVAAAESGVDAFF